MLLISFKLGQPQGIALYELILRIFLYTRATTGGLPLHEIYDGGVGAIPLWLPLHSSVW